MRRLGIVAECATATTAAAAAAAATALMIALRFARAGEAQEGVRHVWLERDAASEGELVPPRERLPVEH